jgi:kynurenine formamidase
LTGASPIALDLENLDLEGPARNGRTELRFVCTPPKIEGVTGSPARPLAIVPTSDRERGI